MIRFLDGHWLEGERGRRIALALLFIAPALLASNMLMARATADFIPPVALAFWRWTATFALLLPFCGVTLWRQRYDLLREWPDLLVLGALGMGVCGAFVYIAADTTTATNIGLIYAASPVLIILLARYPYGEPLSLAQALGVAVALLGVLAIVAKGEPAVLFDLRFTVGDLWTAGAAVGWAGYSILLRYRPSRLPATARLAAIAFGGILVLLPFHVWEAANGQVPSVTMKAVGVILFLAVVSSFGAYQVYGLVQRSLGAARTGLLMYMIPVYNSLLAMLLLGETFETYHALGAALVLPGLLLATARTRVKRAGPRRGETKGKGR